jgi:hypothetical protein
MIIQERGTKDVILFFLSLMLPLLVVLSAYAYKFGADFFSILPGEELPIMLLQVSLYALPYLAFWVAKQRSYTLWLIQTAAIAAVWVWFLNVVEQSRIERTGVNIGAAMIMLAAPLVTALLSFIVFSLVRSSVKDPKDVKRR